MKKIRKTSEINNEIISQTRFLRPIKYSGIGRVTRIISEIIFPLKSKIEFFL